MTTEVSFYLFPSLIPFIYRRFPLLIACMMGRITLTTPSLYPYFTLTHEYG
ncbi:MAG: hypothetical protein Q4D03_09070 [Bacteroidales bacterium]|nr:hypothetical protein [Bacteroidales bacterium]